MSKEIIRPRQFGKVEVSAEESDFELSEQQQKDLHDLYGGIFSAYEPGKIITGKVMSVDSDGVIVDIQYKSDGFIPRYEFSPQELKQFAPGSDIEVVLDELESVDGAVVLSYEKAKASRAWDKIMKLHETDAPVEGTVTHKVKGGLSVDIGIPSFLPGSQVDIQRVTNFDSYVGKPITAHIIKVNKKRGNVIISRRKYLNDQRAESRKEILDALHEGQVIQGMVKNITNYGVFIDIGGVDGLLHITDMTWGRISHPSELVRIGDTITVKVLSFDKDNEKISLGMKQLSSNPWQELDPSIEVGKKITGTISSITDYGLFVEVQKGVEGLVHISEVSWTDRISDLNNQFTVRQEIEVLVVSLDKENRRMSLSVKQLKDNPWQAVSKKYEPGQNVTGTISNITDFGIFVQLQPGVDGLVHISDLSWTEHIEHPNDLFKRGQEVEAVILSIDPENKKISLGIKQLSQDPWNIVEQTYPLNTIVEGTVTKLASFGAFVKLPDGIEGLVHISEVLPGDKRLDTEDKQREAVAVLEKELAVGESRSFRVSKLNKSERKLGLSTKLSAAETKHARAPREPREHVETAAPKAQEKPGKSQLQLELERHAARQQNDDE